MSETISRTKVVFLGFVAIILAFILMMLLYQANSDAAGKDTVFDAIAETIDDTIEAATEEKPEKVETAE
ncbi:MAG: hypothetical protein AAF549_07325 [Pseudomonadota bacterium]